MLHKLQPIRLANDLLGYNPLLLMFRWNHVFPLSGYTTHLYIKMATEASSETLVVIYQIRGHHIPKDRNFDTSRCTDFKYRRIHKRTHSFRRNLCFNNSKSPSARRTQRIYQLIYLCRQRVNHLVSKSVR